MPDLFSEALAQEGLVWLLLTVFVAGVVRGFSGFGTAMIFVPVAAKFAPPVWVLIMLAVMDVFGPLPNLPRAWRDGKPRAVATLALAMLVCLPLGLYLLNAVPRDAFRYLVSILSILLLVLLISGLRYRGEMHPWLLALTGGIAGVSGGAAGLPGPPVIMLYASSTRPVSEIRANIMMFLFLFDIVLIFWLGLKGQLEAAALVLGVLLIIPGVLGNILGAAVFDPAREKMYRGVAYLIVLIAAVTGLPIWD